MGLGWGPAIGLDDDPVGGVYSGVMPTMLYVHCISAVCKYEENEKLYDKLKMVLKFTLLKNQFSLVALRHIS